MLACLSAHVLTIKEQIVDKCILYFIAVISYEKSSAMLLFLKYSIYLQESNLAQSSNYLKCLTVIPISQTRLHLQIAPTWPREE